MFFVTYAKVLLEKNERFSTPLTIAVWEVPVLMQAHGGRIEDLGRVVVKRKERPDATSEYQRLVNRYKHSDQSDIPYVAQVYGVGATGAAKIEAEIAKALVDEAPAPSDDESQEIPDGAFARSGDAEGASNSPLS